MKVMNLGFRWRTQRLRGPDAWASPDAELDRSATQIPGKQQQFNRFNLLRSFQPSRLSRPQRPRA